MDRTAFDRGREPAAAASAGLDLAIAVTLFVGFTLLAWRCRQEPTWSDGRNLIQSFSRGAWRYHHVLYFPAAHLLRGALAAVLPFGPRESLELLSGGSTGLALALVYGSGRVLGAGRAASAFAALLLGSAPGVWFYATTVEVHSLQLAAAAASMWWIVAAARERTLGRDALVPALLFCLLFGAHVSAALCLPALAFLVLRGPGRQVVPGRVVPAALLLAAMAVVWTLENPRGGSAAPFVAQASTGLLSRWSPGFGWKEQVVPAGMLYPFALAAGIAWLRSPERRKDFLPAGLVVLVGTLAPFAMTFMVSERGAYFTWALPPLALCAARILQALGRFRAIVAGTVLVLHGSWAHEEVRAWRDEFPGHAWLPALDAATHGRALVVSLDAREWDSIRNHSELEVVHASPRVLADPDLFLPLLFRAIDRASSSGRSVVMTPGLHGVLFESGAPGAASVAARLTERHGMPEPGVVQGCWVIGPRPSGNGPQ